MSNKNQLEILPNQPTALSKEQYAFNRKLEDIKQLQIELKRISEGMPKAIQQFHSAIAPLEAEILVQAKNQIIAVYEYSFHVKFSKKQTKLLADYLLSEIEAVFEKSNEQDEKLLAIFEKYANMSFEEYEKEVKEEEKAISAHVLKTMFGVEMELDNEKTTEQIWKEAQEKLFEKMENDRNAQNERFENRKKTKAEIKQEAKEKTENDLKKKSIREIYIEMIKIFHPDTELDPDKKMEKEEISKKLTEAYKNNDIFTLLKIETDYLQFDKDRIANLSESKLKIYNDILTSQKEKLSHELHLAKYQNEKVYRGMMYKNSNPSQFLNKQKKELENLIANMKKQVQMLKTLNPSLKPELVDFMEEELMAANEAKNPFFQGFGF